MQKHLVQQVPKQKKKRHPVRTVLIVLLALLLGFTALGLLGLPLLFAVRGFLLAFSIASFVRLFGGAVMDMVYFSTLFSR